MPAPPAAAQPQSAQPQFGASPVTGPTPNQGYEAAVAQRLGVVLNQLTDMLKLAGAGTDLGKSILKMLNEGSKHVPSGSVTPAAERGALERASMQNTQNNAQMQALKQQAAQKAQGGGQGQPGQQPPQQQQPPMAA
jgi:hypothetical protein